MISPIGDYVGGGLQMQVDIDIDSAGNVWVTNDWQDIDSCIGTPSERFRPMQREAACDGEVDVPPMNHGSRRQQ